MGLINMEAKTARKIAMKYKVPKTLNSILKEIELLSQLGFTNTIVSISNNKLIFKLRSLGYIIHQWDKKPNLVDIEWF